MTNCYLSIDMSKPDKENQANRTTATTTSKNQRW